MQNSDAIAGKVVRNVFASPAALIVVSLIAITFTFALANSSWAFESKTKVFSAIIVAYVTFCVVSFFGGNGIAGLLKGSSMTDNGELDARLKLIEDASEYFSGSLRSVDMMRLVAAKIREIVPFDDCVLLVVDPLDGKLKCVQADGATSAMMRNVEFGANVGLAGRACATQMVEFAHGDVVRDETYPALAVQRFRSTAAVPLTNQDEVFAVLQLFSRNGSELRATRSNLLEAAATRIAPLVIGSLSYERSMTTALSDTVTSLPNERAFAIILENQIAETQRKRDTRPLSVLSIDVKNFAEVNERFGHAAGDRLLVFVADKLKAQLRQMDFLARTKNDEFLIALPTANERTALDVIERLTTDFFNCKFRVNDTQSVTVQIELGHATFAADGETCHSLVATATARREQTKNNIPNTVVFFPKEYVN